MASKDLNELIQHAERATKSLQDMGVLTLNVQEATQDRLVSEMQSFLHELDQCDAVAQKLESMQVPMELINVVDSGLSPDMYSEKLKREAKEQATRQEVATATLMGLKSSIEQGAAAVLKDQ